MNKKNNTKKYEYTVFIGRFQPVHKGHLFVFNKALSISDRLIILIGSAHGARTLRNPFSYEERVEIIKQSLLPDILERVIFKPLKDFTYNDNAWIKNIYKQVSDITKKSSTALIGHNKDESTYYLDLFPDWSYVEIDNLAGISATTQRSQFLMGKSFNISSKTMPQPAIDWLQKFSLTPDYKGLRTHYQTISKIKSNLKQIDYPISLTELLLVITHHNFILVKKNHINPEQSLYALPTFNPHKDKQVNTFALEKTHQLLGLSHNEIQNINHPFIFDDPKRNPIGKTIGLCYFLSLSDLGNHEKINFYKLKTEYLWIEKSQLSRKNTYQDHYFILDKVNAL